MALSPNGRAALGLAFKSWREASFRHGKDAEFMGMTGHTNIRTLQGYMKLRPSYLANKMEAVTR